MAFAHSSVIVTGAAVDTRTTDALQFPYVAAPQALTVYLRLVELTAMVTGAPLRGILSVGSLTNAGPRMVFYRNGTTYNVDYTGVGAGVNAPVSGSAVVVGQSIELRASLSAAGVVTLGLSIQGAAETTGTSSAKVLPQAWNVSQILVNDFNGGSFVGQAAYRNICIVAGVKTMQEMRVWAGTD